MIIDNFKIFREHLTFENAKKFDPNTGNIEVINDTYDRYIVQILQRSKDMKQFGASTSNRLIKTYEISSLDYFDKKEAHIKDLCRQNCARAYILPQVRSTYDCLKEMIKIGVDNLENPTIKFQHILRSCMCSMHRSRAKRWILDLDNDSMTEYLVNMSNCPAGQRIWNVESVLKLVQDNLSACGKDPNSAYVVPTKSGFHIITEPFDLQKAYKKCNMMFEGEQKKVIGIKYSGPDQYDLLFKKFTGWLHKDGMSLLYMEI